MKREQKRKGVVTLSGDRKSWWSSGGPKLSDVMERQAESNRRRDEITHRRALVTESSEGMMIEKD